MKRTIWVTLLALLCVNLSLLKAQDKSVEDLQKEAQALNSIRSEENVNKKIKELGEDKKHARKLVQAALLLLLVLMPLLLLLRQLMITPHDPMLPPLPPLLFSYPVSSGQRPFESSSAQ